MKTYRYSFLFDGQKVAAETDCDQNTIRYIRGYELISSDSEKAKTYYHYASDEMDSITHVTDEAGNVCNHYEYDAFGDFTVKEETIENRFGFTGEQYDPIARLYYLRARFYNPVIGRFIQEDSYYGDGLNLYSYCANNPVRYVDPSGFEKQKCSIVTKITEQLESVDPSIRDIADKLNNLSKKNKQAILDQIEKAGGNIDELQKIIEQCKSGDSIPLVPTTASGKFADWYNSLSIEDFNKLWQDKSIKKAIQRQLRSPGKMHEWLMVSRADVFKKWGISAEQVWELRTPTKEVEFVNPYGKHGGTGSTKAHNEILNIIDTSSDFNSFVQELNDWADNRLKGGRESLPNGLQKQR